MQNTKPKLTVRDFFHTYIYSKDEACFHLSERDQRIVKTAKIILSFLTLKILPALCEKKWGKLENCKAKVKDLALQLKGVNFFTLPQSNSDLQEIKKAKDKDCDRILNGLFLGSSRGFVEATTLKFKILEGYKFVETQFTNKYEFKTVITMCPTDALRGDFTELNFEVLSTNFENQQVNWIHPGKDLSDDEASGYVLAYNTTKLKSPLTIETFVGRTPDEVASLFQQKESLIKAIDVEDWFEPVFTEMDKSLLGRANTLVHCQAGVSRSATLVAAYLINRFDLSVETTLNYLKNKRACVNPKFGAFLADYHTRLKEKRA